MHRCTRLLPSFQAVRTIITPTNVCIIKPTKIHARFYSQEPLTFNTQQERVKQVVQALDDVISEFKIPLYNPLDDTQRNKIAKSVLNMNETGNTASNRYIAMGRNLLNLCTAEYLYAHFPNMALEHLSSSLSTFTQRQALVQVARDLNLPTLFGQWMDGVNFATNDFDAMTEEQDSLTFMNAEGRDFENTLSHVILRLIGGIYEQNGVEDARRFIVKHILNKPIDISLVLESFDAKTDFYHLVTTGQYKPHPHSVIEYKAERVSGTDYYTVSLLCNGQVVTQVKAQTKAIGEQKAAQKALNEFYSTFSKRSTPIQNQMNSSV